MIEHDDRAYLYGDGLFETVRVREDGSIWFLKRHQERLRRSGQALGFPSEFIEKACQELQALKGETPGHWRVTVSRPGKDAPLGGSGSVTRRFREHRPRLRPRMTSLKPYYFPEDGLAEHKTCSYLRRIELLRNAVANGYDDAIGLSVDHMVGEAATANVVVVKNGDAATPPVRGILPGITRQVLVETGAVQERPVREQELDEADEIVLLSAGVGALAAAEYKGRELGSCWAGLADQKLEEAAPRP